MKQLHVLQSRWPRPDLSDTYEIYFAPRPLYGTKDWRDEHGHGWYAAVDPADEYAAMWREKNEDMLASLLVWHDDSEVDVYMRQKCSEAGYDWTEFIDAYDATERASMYLGYINDHYRD